MLYNCLTCHISNQVVVLDTYLELFHRIIGVNQNKDELSLDTKYCMEFASEGVRLAHDPSDLLDVRPIGILHGSAINIFDITY